VAVDGEAQQVEGVALEGDEVDSNEVEAGVEDEEVLQEEEGVKGLGVTEEVDSVVVEVVVVVALEVHDNSLFNSYYVYILILPRIPFIPFAQCKFGCGPGLRRNLNLALIRHPHFYCGLFMSCPLFKRVNGSK